MKKRIFSILSLLTLILMLSSCYDNADPNWDQRLGIKEKTNYLVYKDIEFEITSVLQVVDTFRVGNETIPLITILLKCDSTISVKYSLYGYDKMPYSDLSVTESNFSDLPMVTCDFQYRNMPSILESGMLTIEEVDEYGVLFNNYIFNHAIGDFTVNGKAKGFK